MTAASQVPICALARILSDCGVALSVLILLCASPADGLARGAKGTAGARIPPATAHLLPDGSCPMARRGAYWPARSGCLTERLADVEGRGRLAKVILYKQQDRPSQPDGTYTLKVIFNSHRSVAVRFFATVAPSITAADNVDGRPGAELFVHEHHISTYDTTGAYSYVGGRLHRVLALHTLGGDLEYKFAYACSVVNGAPAIVQSEYRRAEDGSWTRSDTVNNWSKGLITQGVPQAPVPVVAPTRSQIGGFC
jgi:hypothetical protein